MHVSRNVVTREELLQRRAPEFNSVLDFDVKILLLWSEFGVPRIVEGNGNSPLAGRQSRCIHESYRCKPSMETEKTDTLIKDGETCHAKKRKAQ